MIQFRTRINSPSHAIEFDRSWLKTKHIISRRISCLIDINGIFLHFICSLIIGTAQFKFGSNSKQLAVLIRSRELHVLKHFVSILASFHSCQQLLVNISCVNSQLQAVNHCAVFRLIEVWLECRISFS